MQRYKDSLALLIRYLENKNSLNSVQIEAMYENFCSIEWMDPEYTTEIDQIKNLLLSNKQIQRYGVASKIVQKYTFQEWLEDVHIFNKNTALGNFIAETARIKHFKQEFWGLFFTISGTIGIVVADYLIPNKLTLIETLLAAAGLTSFISLLWTLVVAVYLYYGQKKQDLDTREFTREIGFLLAKTVIYTLAYLIILIAATTNPVVASLFVLGSLMEVVNESVALYQLRKIPDALNSYQNIQLHCDLQEQKQKIVINLIAAVLMAAVVAFWVFCPGSTLIIAVAAVLAMAVIYGIQKGSLYQVDQTSRKRVHGFFDEFETKGTVSIEEKSTSSCFTDFFKLSSNIPS